MAKGTRKAVLGGLAALVAACSIAKNAEGTIIDEGQYISDPPAAASGLDWKITTGYAIDDQLGYMGSITFENQSTTGNYGPLVQLKLDIGYNNNITGIAAGSANVEIFNEFTIIDGINVGQPFTIEVYADQFAVQPELAQGMSENGKYATGEYDFPTGEFIAPVANTTITNNVPVTLDLSDSTLSFLTESNLDYIVQGSTNLPDGFSTITNLYGNGATNTVSVDTSTTNGFYRVREIR